jgi:hypothetical protein
MISLRKACSAFAVTATLLTVACSDNEVTVEPIVPAKLVVVGSSSVSAPAGMAVSPLLRVKLLTKGNQPVSRRVVHFTVSTGGILSRDSSFTNENGEASTGLTVGAVGDYTVTATSEGVAPVTFSATATLPVPKLLLAGEGNNQVGLAGEPLAPLKALVIKDDGSAAAGIPVTFAVTSGGGSLTTTSAVTDVNGVATTTFTIGSTGTQTVTVSSPGFQSAVFTAAIADPCLAARAYTVPSTISRTLDAADCKQANNRFVEFFDFTASAPFQITESSTAFVPSLSIKTLTGDTIAFNTPAASPATFKAFLAAGTYRIGASTSLANTTGAYTLTTTSSPAEVTACERVYINKGTNSGAQNIAATDCQFQYDDGNGFGVQLHYGDRYRIFLKAGAQITIVMSGTADHMIRVTDLATGIVTVRDNFVKGATETLAYTAVNSGQYFIDAATFNNNANGSPPDVGGYTLTIQ